MKDFRLFLQFFFFFILLAKFSIFINSNDCIGKVPSNSIRLYPVFIKKKINLIKKRDYFLVKKCDIQVIITMIMLTRSSERIFNRSRYGSYLVIQKCTVFVPRVASLFLVCNSFVEVFVLVF